MGPLRNGAIFVTRMVLRSEVFTSANGGINQRVWLLPNKGEEFLEVLEINEMHEIVSHVLGEEFQLSSFSSNIAKPVD